MSLAVLTFTVHTAFSVDNLKSATAVRLTHRFDAGSEFVYDFSSTLRQSSTVSGEKLVYDMTLAGTIRQTVVEVDPASGTALFGLAGTGTWQMVSGPGGISGTTRDQTWIAAYRLEPSGRIVARDTRKEDRRQNLVHRTMNQVSENAQIFPAFPTNHLAVGSTWNGPVLLPLPGIRQTGTATATVREVKTENNATYYVIRCEIASEKGQSFATYQSDLHRPDIEIKGYSEGVFDIERGVWLKTEINLTAKLTGPSFDGSMEVQGKTALASVGRPPESAFRDKAAMIRAFEEAVAKLYGNDVDGAEKSLMEQKDGTGDTEWKKGLATTLGLVELAKKELADDRRCQPRKESPESKLLAEADLAAQEEKWEEAVKKYEKVAKETAGSDSAMQALSSAATIYERNLGKKSAADALRRRIVVMRAEMSERRQNKVDATLSLYKSASAHETAGELKKAAELYESFLAGETNGIPAPTRVMARYRLAGVYDRLGDTRKALAGYEAVTTAEGDDEYSVQLKQKSREKIQEAKAGAGK